MDPTTTSTARQIKVLLAEFTDRLSLAAVCVRRIKVPAIQASKSFAELLKQLIKKMLKQVRKSSNVLGLTNDDCVPRDILRRP